MNYTKNRICFLDTETTSVYWNSAAPIQIAALVCDADGNILDGFNERIKTNHTITPGASAVHGIYAKDLKNCRSEPDVLKDFIAWMDTMKVDIIVTYNGEAFDRPMLNKRVEVFKIDTPYFDKTRFPGIDCRDTVMWAKKANLYGLKDLGRRWKLTLVADKLGFSTEDAHDALADVRMLKDVFFCLDPQMYPTKWSGGSTSLF